MSTYARPTQTPVSPPQTASALVRWLPLAGAGYGVLSMAGDLVVDAFPDENTPLGKLTSYYAAHHHQVGRGGLLMEIAAICMALFGAALVVRVRGANPVAAAILTIGTAATFLSDAYEAATFRFLGNNAAESHLAPAALQAWHMSAAGFGVSAPLVVFVVGLVVAGRALSAWLVWSAVILAVAQFTPVGFLAGMVMLLWFVVAGTVLALRPARSSSLD